MNENQKRVKLWNKDFIIIITINFLVFLNHMMILSTFPIFITSVLGGTDSISGGCATAFSLLAVISRPIVGWMLDSGKRKVILVIGICGLAIMPMGYLALGILVTSVVLAVICRMANGIIFAMANTSASTIATDIVPHQRFSEGMGMFGMSNALATACAPAIGELLIINHTDGSKSFTLLFCVATGIMVFSFILFAFLKTPKIKAEKKPFSIKGLIDKNALPASATVLVFLLTYGSLESFTLKFAAASEDISVSGGVYFACMAVALLLTRITVGRIADQKGEAIFVYVCNVLMFAALMMLAVFPNNTAFIISAFLAGFGFGGVEPALLAMAVSIASPEERGAANSTFLCAYDIGIGLGGGIAGVLIDAVGYNTMFAVLSLACVGSVIVYMAIGRHHESSVTYRLKQSQTNK